jgi:hypothetical protein
VAIGTLLTGMLMKYAILHIRMFKTGNHNIQQGAMQIWRMYIHRFDIVPVTLILAIRMLVLVTFRCTLVIIANHPK